MIGVRAKAKGAGEELVAVAEFSQSGFLDAFFKPQVQNVYLTGQGGEILISPRQEAHAVESASLVSAIESLPKDESRHFGVSKSSRDGLLISFADVGIGDLRVISVVPKSAALAATDLIKRQSILFLILLLGLAVFISVIGASGLTNGLKRLHLATLEIGKGNLTVHIPQSGRDEIADVSQSFNKMVSEVRRLLRETAEKVRMEGELKTASLIQSTFFPNPSMDCGRVQLRGYYHPASECSGDWWNFVQIGSKIFIIVCDATGHGVPAALLTSAARSAFSIAVELPDVDAGKCLEFLNRAIFDTTQGKMQMTAFVAMLDSETGDISFANAGHEPPFLYRKKIGLSIEKRSRS